MASCKNFQKLSGPNAGILQTYNLETYGILYLLILLKHHIKYYLREKIDDLAKETNLAKDINDITDFFRDENQDPNVASRDYTNNESQTSNVSNSGNSRTAESPNLTIDSQFVPSKTSTKIYSLKKSKPKSSSQATKRTTRGDKSKLTSFESDISSLNIVTKKMRRI